MCTSTTHSDWKLDVTQGVAASLRILQIRPSACSVFDSMVAVLISTRLSEARAPHPSLARHRSEGSVAIPPEPLREPAGPGDLRRLPVTPRPWPESSPRPLYGWSSGRSG